MTMRRGAPERPRRAHARSRIGASSVLPGGVRRFVRAPLRLVAVVLLGAVAIASAGIQNAAATALRETLDANWRGAYDILVTAPGASTAVGDLLAPNSLASGARGMTLADVDRVRAVDGVEVAAPIGEMVSSSIGSGLINVSVPQGEWGGPDAAQAYRVSMTFTTDDGLGERVVATTSRTVVIDELPPPPPPPVDPGATCQFDQFTLDPAEFPLLCGGALGPSQVIVINPDFQGAGSTDQEFDGHHIFSLNLSPEVATRITLIDPEAERALLGDAGDFLAPLVEIAPDAELTADRLREWALADGGEFAEDFLADEADLAAFIAGFRDAEFQAEIQRAYEVNGQEYVAPESPPVVQVPLLVADRGPAPFEVALDVVRLGALPPATATQQPIFERIPPELRDAAGEPVGSTVLEASDALNRFGATLPSIPWPGTESLPLPNGLVFGSPFIYYSGVPTGAEYAIVEGEGDAPSVSLEPSGYALPLAPSMGQQEPQPFALDAEGAAVGAESVYGDILPLPAPPISSTIVPVGVFSVDALADLQSSLSDVPLGAYQPLGSTLVDSPNAELVGAELRPSVSGLGLVGPETVAIASIRSAAAWSQESPVSAVRVRVGGITGYTPEAQARVLAVAERIDALGLEATVVAGSSPSAVQVQVDAYAFGTTDPAGEQEIGPLGTIEQEWSELGAAARADSAISTATGATLVVALGSAAILLGAVQLAGVPARRSDARVYRQLGWRRARIAGWWAREEAPALVIVALASAVAVALSGGSSLTIGVAGAVLAIAVVLAVAAVALGVRLPHARGRRRVARAERLASRRAARVRLRGVLGFGLRQPRIHPLPAASMVVAIALVGLAAASLVRVWDEGVRAAGASLLAQFVAAQAAVPQLALGAAGIIAAIVLAILARRLDLQSRAAQWATLRGIGWTSRSIARAQRAEAVVTAAPAIVLGVVVVGLLAVLVIELPAVEVVPLALTAALASTAVAIAVYLPGKRVAA